MKFELSQNIERWCQEALREIDGTPASPFEKVQAAVLVHQVKVLDDISQKLSEISKGTTRAQATAGTR
jgi:hypothetical protein